MKVTFVRPSMIRGARGDSLEPLVFAILSGLTPPDVERVLYDDRLDAIPFEKSFLFDMEVWHWRGTTVDYAATTYWYGRPGAKATVGPMPEEAKSPVKYKNKYEAKK